MKNRVAIIGGGVIGLLSAYYLNEKGFKVTVFDKGNFDNGASHGNAGMIVPSHFVPLASPDAIAKGIKWIFDSKSPFYIKPRISRDLFIWLYHFISKSNSKHVKRCSETLYHLNLRSKRLYEDLQETLGDFGLQESGLVMYCNSEEGLAEEMKLAHTARRMGQEVTILDKVDLNLLEPEVEYTGLGGVHFREDAHLNPNQLMQKVQGYLRNVGVELVRNCELDRIEKGETRVNGLLINGECHEFDHYVVAAGAWSQKLVKSLGLKLYLQGAKGYSFEVDRKHFNLSICSILTEARIACTPIGDKVRFAGTLTLDGMNDIVDKSRFRSIYEKIPKYFPQLEAHQFDKYSIWHGYRPCSADGMPYLGRSDRYNNLYVATGHGMMGLSLGAVTGQIVSQLVCGDNIDFNMELMDVDRH